MTPGSTFTEGQKVSAFFAMAAHRCFVDQVFPNSEYVQLRYLDAPHRAPLVVHLGDVKPLES